MAVGKNGDWSEIFDEICMKYEAVYDRVQQFYDDAARLTLECQAQARNAGETPSESIVRGSLDVAASASEAMHILRAFNGVLPRLLGQLEWVKDRDLDELRKHLGDVKHLVERFKDAKPSDPDVRSAVLEMSGGKCFYCRVDLTGEQSAFHVDHLVPKASGGPDTLANFVASCPACNMSKSDSHVVQFMRRKAGNA